MTTLLVTGGAGYIGAHTLVALARAGFDAVVLDDLSNSHPSVLGRVRELTGRPVRFIQGDVRDRAVLRRVFASQSIAGVIHFAAKKAVGESVRMPLRYYDVNVGGTVALLEVMDEAGVGRVIFSSSATVYGVPHFLPYTEAHPVAPTSPYGHTKAMVEQVLQDWVAGGDRTAISLRYFNPIGAHPSGRIGESPQGIPNNLFPFITQVAVGKRPHLDVFGNDYATVDGTGVRDYLHVMDLAAGHVRAFEHALHAPAGYTPVNLGTGRGTSVLELVAAFERVTGQRIPHQVRARRPGDIDQFWADAALAEKLLGWRAERDIDAMCADGWKWQSNNPNGYES